MKKQTISLAKRSKHVEEYPVIVVTSGTAPIQNQSKSTIAV